MCGDIKSCHRHSQSETQENDWLRQFWYFFHGNKRGKNLPVENIIASVHWSFSAILLMANDIISNDGRKLFVFYIEMENIQTK